MRRASSNRSDRDGILTTATIPGRRSRAVMSSCRDLATSPRIHAHRGPPPVLSPLGRTICRIVLRDRQMPAAAVTPGSDGTLAYHAPGSHPRFQTAANCSNFPQ
jgi:hypothetical protein